MERSYYSGTSTNEDSLIPDMEDIGVLDDYIIHIDGVELGEIFWEGN